MNTLLIISSIAVGMVVGMAFMACFTAEMRKHDHEQLRKANALNIRLQKELNELRTRKAVQPAVDKKIIEIVDYRTPEKDVKFGGF